MIRFTSTITFTFFLVIGYGQYICESIISYKDTFNPIFSAESAILSMDYLKNYTISKTDTSYLFILDIKEQNVELEQMSLGAILFNYDRLGMKSEKVYAIKSNADQTILNKDEFMEFYNCINEVYSYIAQQQTYGKSKNNIVARSNVENIIVGGEYRPSKIFGKKVQFYFKVGDKATYEMNIVQFESIVKVLREIKNYWKEK